MEEDWAIVKSQTSVTKRVFDTRLQYASLNDTHSDQLRNLLTKEFRWKYDSSIKDWKLCNFQNVNVSSFEKHGAIWKEAKLTQVLELLSHQLVNEFLELAYDSPSDPHHPCWCTFEKKFGWVFPLESKL